MTRFPARHLAWFARFAMALASLSAPVGALADAGSSELSAERETALVRMVRQDCGSCHGMQLTGGLGPALTREALVNKPPPWLAAVITHGLPGTPMPPWKALLTDREARWIAERLSQGFPTQN
ncbi:c-type cytochrome [Diaphorobacter caeni]|uniref:c-type cytochrome n=1 Tax=Diaphorobacter caeni TaxID=2784387 RepID=UPI00188E6B5F|nr:cytochrome c [Diaphorobacter caeni]MBF5006930.1 cytochrome c [Diaphorobacter caeni]